MRPAPHPNSEAAVTRPAADTPELAIDAHVAGLPPSWPEALRLAAQLRQFDANTTVFRRGQPVQAVYQVQAGRVLLRRDEAGGESITLQSAGPGDFVAEASLFSARYHCDGVCPVASQLLVLPAQTVLASLRLDSTFAIDWIRLLSRQLMQSRARAERLTLRSPRERILHCLRLEGDARGVFTVPGSLMQWARALGIAHETLYRTLAQLERDGFIARDGTRVVLTGNPPTRPDQGA
nr:Crp/Fnr family transcriptional regulator [Burkholderia ambifaria]